MVSYSDFESLSEALDNYYLEKESEARFRSLAAAARNAVSREISKRERLIERLRGDLERHGDAEKWKRFGDLLLANVSTAERQGDTMRVIDYFNETAPVIEVPVDSNDSITSAAEGFFKRYTKARNAAAEIAKRIEMTNLELRELYEKRAAIESSVESGDEETLLEFVGKKEGPKVPKPSKQTDPVSGVRRLVSSDGFEILVGKKARDNDLLTFRMAKSLDLWMHAADYPGSHVVIRNPNRKDIPPGTLLEAAQLAAFYSQGKTQPKAAVHYTQKKFVNKPRGAAPGLVSLASFKTILVEPKFPSTVETR